MFLGWWSGKLLELNVTKQPVNKKMSIPFSFVCTNNKRKSVLKKPEIADYLKKWSLKTALNIQYFSFNEPFQIYQKQDFAEAFFKDSNVITTLISDPVKGTTLGVPAHSVKVQRVPCNLTSTALFKRLEGKCVRNNHIMPCAEVDLGNGIYIQDRLRSVLLNEEDEHWNVFSEEERMEFLVRLVRLLVVGGQWCQYEDLFQPYLQTAVDIYKDLISAHKDSESGKPTVHSFVLEVEARTDDGRPVLPLKPDHLQDEAYLCINPDQRTCAVLTHHYGGYFD